MLFLLKRRDKEIAYDETVSVVIRATSREEARRLANTVCGDEGPIWTDSDRVTCYDISNNGRSKVILRNFRAG